VLLLVLGFTSNNEYEYEYDDEYDFNTKKIKRVAHRNEPPVKGGQNEAL
jgi:hypothetical protein